MKQDIHSLTPPKQAAFVVIRERHRVWAVTRDGKHAGKIGLPGGKSDPGETIVETAIREAREEGLDIRGKAGLIHVDLIDGFVIHWFAVEAAKPLENFKEKHRGIQPVLVPFDEIAASGFGNAFLKDYLERQLLDETIIGLVSSVYTGNTQ